MSSRLHTYRRSASLLDVAENFFDEVWFCDIRDHP